jgi:hypothetical protein
MELVPLTPSLGQTCRRRRRRGRWQGGGGEHRRGSVKQAHVSAESTEVEDAGPGRGRTAGPWSRSSLLGRGKAQGRRAGSRSRRRATVEVTPPGHGRGHAAMPRSMSRHRAEVDRAVVEVPHARRRGGASSTTVHRHRTTMLAGARRRRAWLLLHAGARRAFHPRTSGRSGGVPEHWLHRPPRVGEESKCRGPG